jgi:putative DNA primase/helicase
MSEKIQSLNELSENPTQSQLIRQQLSELAELDQIDYALKRKEAAKKLNLPVGTLDSLVKDISKNNELNTRAKDFEEWIVEPWPDPVKGAELFNQIFNTMQRFIIADKESLEAAAMWTALTWLVEHATVLPIAMITAPEKGCGKTVFLSTIQEMVCRPIQACNISSSSLFRSVEQWQPTLLIDEADSFLRENEELRGILNSGHTRNSAYVIRTEEIKGEWQPVKFKTWSAKAISGIKLEGLSPTLTSRAILLPLRKKKPSEKTENLRHADPKQFQEIKSKLHRWALDNGQRFSKLRPEMPELQNRDGDNWEPLLAIAQLAGPEWFTRIKNAALKIVGKTDSSPSLEQELLSDIQEVFNKKNVDRLSSVNLIDALLADELGPWQTYNRGKPITARQLARKLKPYSIHPKPIKIAGVTHKGYLLSDFTDTFARYLSFFSPGGNLTVTQLQPANNEADRAFLSVTDRAKVTEEKSLFPATDAEGNQVTDKTGGIEEKEENEVVEVEI